MKRTTLMGMMGTVVFLWVMKAGAGLESVPDGDGFQAWALPGNCRVFPVGEGSPDTDPETFRRFRERNNVWDAVTGRIRVTAARRDTADFQLIIRKAGTELAGIDVRSSSLQGGSGVLSGARVHFFLAGYIEEKGVFYPDVLVPFGAGGVTPFSIPHGVPSLAVVPGQENQTVWVDIDVPAGTAAGLYTGTVTVAARAAGGREVARSLALELEVPDITLPAERSAAVALDVYGGIIKGLKMDKTPDDMIALERQFYRLAREHRMFVNAIRFPQSGAPRQGYLPDFQRNEKGELQADWTGFDKRYGPYLDGTAFDDGMPVEQFCLYFNQYWPAEQWPTSDFLDPASRSPEKTRYEAAWMEYGREYIRHFREKGWDRVLFIVKLNHYKKAGQKFPLLWNTDMPCTGDDFKAVAYYADLIHRTFSNAAPIRVQFRVDPLHSFCREAGCDFAEWDEQRAGEVMKEIDLWCFEWEHGFSHLAALRDLKAKGKTVSVYQHGWTCLEAAPIFRGLGWVLWAGGLEGYAGWNEPHADLKAWREYPRDNYTMYVGWEGGRKAAFPSIRLKLQRDSLADYEYLKLASARDPSRTAGVTERMVRFAPRPDTGSGRRFTGPVPAADPGAYADARRDLAAILCGKAFPGPLAARPAANRSAP
jgi:hypothetical protein